MAVEVNQSICSHAVHLDIYLPTCCPSSIYRHLHNINFGRKLNLEQSALTNTRRGELATSFAMLPKLLAGLIGRHGG